MGQMELSKDSWSSRNPGKASVATRLTECSERLPRPDPKREPSFRLVLHSQDHEPVEKRPGHAEAARLERACERQKTEAEGTAA